MEPAIQHIIQEDKLLSVPPGSRPSLFQKATWRWRCAPRIFLIGAQKAGTTSVLHHLLSHKQILPPVRKEIWYFNVAQNFGKGVSWYASHFPMRGLQQRATRRLGLPVHTIDATANYFEFPEVASRLYQFAPDARLILLLRNPVDRAFSHYKMAVKYGFEHLSFEEALAVEVERIEMGKKWPHNYAYQRLAYRAKGEYSRLLKPWLEVFPTSQLLIVRSEDLFQEPKSTYTQILSFLQLEAMDATEFSKANVGQEGVIQPATRNQLQEHYKPFNAELEQLLGRSIHWD